MNYNESELLAVLLSREVRDGEVSACGAHSQIPAAGLLLAQALHAPNAELIIPCSRRSGPRRPSISSASAASWGCSS
jgi:hypothetical protein